MLYQQVIKTPYTEKYDLWQCGHNILWTPEKAWRKKQIISVRVLALRKLTSPIPLDQSSWDHLSRPSLILKARLRGEGAEGTKPFKIFFKILFHHCLKLVNFVNFPGGSVGKESTCNARDLGLIPGPGRSPGEGNCNPLQYSGLKNSMDRGPWWATVQRVTKSWTRLSNFHFIYLIIRKLSQVLLIF